MRISLAVLLLVLNINARGGMTFTFNELLATPRGIQELMNDKGHNHQILVHIDGVRTYNPYFSLYSPCQNKAFRDLKSLRQQYLYSVPNPFSPLSESSS